MEYFGKAGLNGQTAKLTTVKQVREIGSAVLTCEDLSNWATDTPVFFATYKVDIDTQKIVPNSQINWRGKVNVENNTIIEIQADSDTPDKGNAIGDIVECLPTAGWANSLVDGISVIHKQDGTLKANVVKGDNIDFESFEDGSIEPGKLKKVARTKDSKGWTISITPDGRKRWLISGSVTVGCNGSAWGEALLTDKPAELIGVDLSTGYIIQASVSTNDAALVCWFDAYSITSNDNTLRVKLRNPHSSRLDRPAKYFIAIEELL